MAHFGQDVELDDPFLASLVYLVLQNQFEDASDDNDEDTTTTAAAAASATGDGPSTAKAPAKAKSNNRSKSNKSNSCADRAAASLFFSDSTAPRHR